MDSHSVLANMLLFMAAAVVAVPLATRLGLGSILGYLIAGAVMIESNHHKTHVVLGARVTVRDIEFDETDTYVIVGSAEANPAEGRISNESPMGRALMGGRVGQHKQINTPGGTINVDIVEIE